MYSTFNYCYAFVFIALMVEHDDDTVYLSYFLDLFFFLLSYSLAIKQQQQI